MVDFSPAEMAAIRAAFGAPEPDPEDRLIAALRRARVFEAEPAAGHQATAAERAGAYRQFAEARERLYGRPPDRERPRNSLSPEAASPLVRKIFGG
jgi:hypothetical protein